MQPSQIDGDALEKVPSQDWDILKSFPKRRHANDHCADTKVKIASEFLLLNELYKIFVTGGDEAHVQLALLDVTQAPEPFLFQNL